MEGCDRCVWGWQLGIYAMRGKWPMGEGARDRGLRGGVTGGKVCLECLMEWIDGFRLLLELGSVVNHVLYDLP